MKRCEECNKELHIYFDRGFTLCETCYDVAEMYEEVMKKIKDKNG